MKELSSKKIGKLFYFMTNKFPVNNIMIKDVTFKFTDEELEKQKGYIKWCFPTTDKTGLFNNDPTLKRSDLIVFQKDWLCQKS